MRILLVDDDRDLAEYVSRTLEEEGNTVTVKYDGESGLRAAQSATFDIIVLDVMLPFLDGVQVIRRLRADNITTPILLLTARDASQDVVRGLDAGADDYLTKPFSFDVLLARIRARTRKGQPGANARLRYSDLIADLETYEVWRHGRRIELTRTEFAILECLLRSPGRVIGRRRLIENVWGTARQIPDNNLDVFIRLLRAKVDPPGQCRLIQTVRGIGYSLRESEG